MTAYDLAPLDETICQKIYFKFDPSTRVLSLSVPEKRPDFKNVGTTIDSNSVAFFINLPDRYSDAWFEFAVSITKPDHTTFRPISPLIKDPDTGYYFTVIQNAILSAAFKLRKLPLQLIIRYGDTVFASRNPLSLDVSRGINALGTIRECYENLNFKGDSSTWSKTRVYREGAIVIHDEEIYFSTCNNNIGNEPSNKSFYWSVPGIAKGVKFRPVSIPFICTEEGQETHWELTHGLGTMNFVYSIRIVGEESNEYVNATLTAMPDRNTVWVDFAQPRVGRYILNMIPCKDSEIYDQKVYEMNPIEKVNMLKFNVTGNPPLPKYVQIYDRSIAITTLDQNVANEFFPMIFQNSDRGFIPTELFFFNGTNPDDPDRTKQPLLDLFVDAIFISPADTNVKYFTNIGYSEPAVIGSLNQLYMIQLYDLDTDERIWGEVTQDSTTIKIGLNSNRNFVAVLIEPTEVHRFSGDDRDWVVKLDGKYKRPVAVQCFGINGELLNPRIYVDENYAIARFDNEEGQNGRMLICGELNQN